MLTSLLERSSQEELAQLLGVKPPKLCKWQEEQTTAPIGFALSLYKALLLVNKPEVSSRWEAETGARSKAE